MTLTENIALVVVTLGIAALGIYAVEAVRVIWQHCFCAVGL